MTKSKTTTKPKPIKSAPKKDVKKTKESYTLQVKVNDKVFDAKGETISDCLKQFVESKEYPFGAKTRMFIAWSNGGVVRHKVFPTATARRVLMMMRYKTTAFDLLVAQLNRDL